MALTSSQLQASIDTLTTAIGRGVLKVENNGESVTYNSIDDMIAAVNFLKGQLVVAQDDSALRQTFAAFSNS
ncbi:MAG: hypothetical protein WBK91_04075 [Alphaproteobacteria bacterium]